MSVDADTPQSRPSSQRARPTLPGPGAAYSHHFWGYGSYITLRTAWIQDKTHGGRRLESSRGKAYWRKDGNLVQEGIAGRGLS